MLRTYADIQNDVVVKMGITTTAAYYTDAIIGAWIQQAERWATSYKKWPFSEGRLETTYTTANEEWNFEGVKADSIRLLQIGGKRFEKLNFEDYKIYREEEASGTDRVYTDFGRTVLINENADASGTLTVWAQYAPAQIDITDDTAETIFSNGDEEGNEAIVEEVLHYADIREEKEGVSEYHHNRAVQILENLWKNYIDEQFNYKTHRVRGGMFDRVDIVEGGLRDEIFKRDQF